MVTTRLQEFRKAKALSAADLARRVGISRQTIYAMEDGSFVPNTTVSLRLARVLDVKVEELFCLLDEPSADPITAELINDDLEPAHGHLVRYCRVGKRLIAIPVPSMPQYLPPADGLIRSKAGHIVAVEPATRLPDDGKRLLIAGCDPALSVISELLSSSAIDIICVSSPSRRALRWLKQNKVHAAGLHLRDRASGDYNVPFIEREFPTGSVRVVTFAVWEQGLVVQSGNPKSIRGIADLGAPGITIINREKGSGSRDLLDRSLRDAGISTEGIGGYKVNASGHLPAAYAVAVGAADCCIASRSASRCFGLAFIPLAVERFDLSFTKDALELPAAKAVLDLLNRGALRNKLKGIAGYDTTHTGEMLM